MLVAEAASRKENQQHCHWPKGDQKGHVTGAAHDGRGKELTWIERVNRRVRQNRKKHAALCTVEEPRVDEGKGDSG